METNYQSTLECPRASILKHGDFISTHSTLSMTDPLTGSGGGYQTTASVIT